MRKNTYEFEIRELLSFSDADVETTLTKSFLGESSTLSLIISDQIQGICSYT